MMDELLPNWENHFEWNYLRSVFPPCKVLDYGCGYGYSDIYLAREGFEVWGYDPDEKRIAVALRMSEFDIAKDRAHFSHDRFPQMRYDIVWLSHVLEHVPYDKWSDIFIELNEVSDVILVSVPLGYAYDMPEHIHHWRNDGELLERLMEHSDRRWTTSVDEENKVIRAIGEK